MFIAQPMASANGQEVTDEKKDTGDFKQIAKQVFTQT